MDSAKVHEQLCTMLHRIRSNSRMQTGAAVTNQRLYAGQGGCFSRRELLRHQPSQGLIFTRRQLLRFALMTVEPVLIAASAMTWRLESIRTRLRTALALIELEGRR